MCAETPGRHDGLTASLLPAAGATDADGRTVATRGFYIDITKSVHADLQQSITDQVQLIVSHREDIDQAKGMLMVIYRLSADAAFAVLKWRSQELNVKLSTIAEKLVTELPDLLNAHPTMRAPIDHYLLTVTPPKATAVNRAPV